MPVGKRTFDIVVGTVLIVAAIPLLALAALASAIAFRANPFFIQTRVGQDGRHFRFLKIRTLPTDVSTSSDKYALQSVVVPRVGRFLRGTHLDELPQLFLVPIGKMSLVGPRPDMPELVERYPREFADLRHKVKPGVTGLWQISVASGRLIFEEPDYDLHYLDNASPLYDLWILVMTPLTALGLRPPVELAAVPDAITGRGLVEVIDLDQLAEPGIAVGVGR